MSSAGAAGAAATNARAEASRRNGAKSRGPKTPEGKARASQNALKHGLRAGKHVVLPDEDAAAFAALEAALLEDLAPVGALQTVLARQIVSAAWRLARADRIEAEILIFRQRGEADLGLAVTRDGNTARGADAAALPRRRAGRIPALAAHPQGAPGRGGEAGARATERTRRGAGVRARRPARRHRPGRARPARRRRRARAAK